MAGTRIDQLHMDTWVHLLGSGATDYEWYQELRYTPDNVGESDNRVDYRNWTFTFTEYGDNGSTGKTYTIGHKDVMQAMRKMVSKDRPEYVSDAAVRECKCFLDYASRDDTDFDAATADEVLQVAAFGKVIYG